MTQHVRMITYALKYSFLSLHGRFMTGLLLEQYAHNALSLQSA